jgi:hypothetical protein
MGPLREGSILSFEDSIDVALFLICAELEKYFGPGSRYSQGDDTAINALGRIANGIRGDIVSPLQQDVSVGASFISYDQLRIASERYLRETLEALQQFRFRFDSNLNF